MKDFIKQILGRLRLLKFLREARFLYYRLYDFVGACFFRDNNAPKQSDKINKILLVRADRVGDLVVTTPAIRSVRNKYPNAQIDLYVSAYAKDLVVNNPNIDNVKIYQKDALDCDYDLAIAFHPGRSINKFLYQSGAKTRIGVSGWGGSFYLTNSIPDDREARPRHEVDTALELTALAGCMLEEKYMEIEVTDDGESYIEDFIKKNNLCESKFIVVHPGARQEHVRWDKNKFAIVADKIIEKYGIAVVLTGAEVERTLVEQVAEKMVNKPILAIGIPLAALVSLYKRSELFVGNITGPMHIAVGLGKKIVTISGVWGCIDDYRYWGPWEVDNIVVHKDVGCKHCHPSDCKNYECMKAINPDDVMAGIDKLLKE